MIISNLTGKLSNITIEEIFKLKAQGQNTVEIAEHLGCSISTVYQRMKLHKAMETEIKKQRKVECKLKKLNPVVIPKYAGEQSKQAQQERDLYSDREIPLTDDTKWQTPCWTTGSIAIAAVLILKGNKLVKTEIDSQNRLLFLFKETMELNGLKKDYWDHKVSVDARANSETVAYLISEGRKAAQRI